MTESPDSATETVAEMAMRAHIGRSWGGPGPLEHDCPCPKAACGLVIFAQVDPNCLEHPAIRMKSMRSGHLESHCPATAEPGQETR